VSAILGNQNQRAPAGLEARWQWRAGTPSVFAGARDRPEEEERLRLAPSESLHRSAVAENVLGPPSAPADRRESTGSAKKKGSRRPHACRRRRGRAKASRLHTAAAPRPSIAARGGETEVSFRRSQGASRISTARPAKLGARQKVGRAFAPGRDATVVHLAATHLAALELAGQLPPAFPRGERTLRSLEGRAAPSGAPRRSAPGSTSKALARNRGARGEGPASSSTTATIGFSLLLSKGGLAIGYLRAPTPSVRPRPRTGKGTPPLPRRERGRRTPRGRSTRNGRPSGTGTATSAMSIPGFSACSGSKRPKVPAIIRKQTGR